jgi:hypothetical protein
VLTLRTAASLLAAASSHDSLLPVARALGFAGRASPLDQRARCGVGLGAETVAASVIAGDGALRVLVVELQEAAPVREILTHLAARLSTRAAHGLWIVLAAQSQGRAIGIGVWSSTDRGPRLSLSLVDRQHILDSDAETVRLLAAAGTGQDLTTHARWIDILGRDAMSRRFFRALRRLVAELETAAPLPETARSELALLCTSRLLFLSFLEARGWLDGDPSFLANQFDGCMREGGGFHQRVLQPLFFGTLNTPASRRAARARAFGRVPFLNGGLFSPTSLERRHRAARFTDATLGALMGDLLGRYRFTAREESTSLEEAAVDPEMLGRAFECLMATSAYGV